MRSVMVRNAPQLQQWQGQQQQPQRQQQLVSMLISIKSIIEGELRFVCTLAAAAGKAVGGAAAAVLRY